MNPPRRKLSRYSTFDLLRDLGPYLRPYSWSITTASIFRIIGDLILLYPAYALASAVNYLTAYHSGMALAPLWHLFFLFCAAYLVQNGLQYYAKILMYSSSERVDLDLQVASVKHLFKLDISWHERENTGNRLKKINRGSDSADRVLRIWIQNILKIAINFFGALFVLSRFDHLIAFLTFVFLLTYFAFARLMRKRASEATIVANMQEEEVEGLLFESMNNIRTVKVLGMARILTQRIIEESDDLYRKVKKRMFWFQTGGYSRAAYAEIFQAVMLGVVIFGIIHGRYELGFLILFNSYFGKLLDGVGELADAAQDYVVAKLSIGRLFEILHEPIGIDIEEGKSSMPAGWKTISFKNVSFSYGNNPVLSQITFDIARGEKVGVVGLSGAGKSTLFKLLLKEYESYTGEILIDDVPLRDISRQEYFKHAAVVLQDTEVFNFSLRDNMLLANTDESENQELFKRALQVAHVDEFAARLPDGLDTLIGEKGIRLSGGERQRVGIARAVFKAPELLLLDEATSHLDIESEGKIQDSLHEFFTTVTALVIAHRLTTIKEMDTIMVFEEGRILERGSFAELYAKKGRFHELWEQQRL